MKKSMVREVVEVKDEGLVALMDKHVEVYCNTLIYTGILRGVNDTCILLESPSIVYETGKHSDKTFADAQKLSHSIYIQCSAIESFFETDKR